VPLERKFASYRFDKISKRYVSIQSLRSSNLSEGRCSRKSVSRTLQSPGPIRYCDVTSELRVVPVGIKVLRLG
jgi:hypothetical protein